MVCSDFGLLPMLGADGVSGELWQLISAVCDQRFGLDIKQTVNLQEICLTLAGAAESLLEGLSSYGGLDKSPYGNYIEKAETYLHGYAQKHGGGQAVPLTSTPGAAMQEPTFPNQHHVPQASVHAAGAGAHTNQAPSYSSEAEGYGHQGPSYPGEAGGYGHQGPSYPGGAGGYANQGPSYSGDPGSNYTPQDSYASEGRPHGYQGPAHRGEEAPGHKKPSWYE
jgi:hypothetical protein